MTQSTISESTSTIPPPNQGTAGHQCCAAVLDKSGMLTVNPFGAHQATLPPRHLLYFSFNPFPSTGTEYRPFIHDQKMVQLDLRAIGFLLLTGHSTVQ